MVVQAAIRALVENNRDKSIPCDHAPNVARLHDDRRTDEPPQLVRIVILQIRMLMEILEVEKSALEWKRELFRKWLRVLAHWPSDILSTVRTINRHEAR
jgi:hypothetical protein